MTPTEISYSIFIVALLISIVLDFFVFNKKQNDNSIKSATYQYLFWVVISITYGVYLYVQHGADTSIKYISAYFMEMSLSVDNIFVFVLLFSSLQIKKESGFKVLMIGVFLAIVFRIIFIVVGIALVEKFHWILYIFGALLVYTGIKLFFQNQEEEHDVRDGKIYKFVTKYLRYTDVESGGKYIVTKNGRAFFTKLSLAVVLIGITDIVFALDSIPAVFAISTDKLVVFSSNIFAVLGLRALFFIVQKMADKFDYLQQGIAIVLVFIGVKMFLEIIHINIPIWISLLVIVCCIAGGLLYSVYANRKASKLNNTK